MLIFIHLDKMTMSKTPAILILLLGYLCSCAPSRFVKPLAAKQKAVSLSLGGPLVAYGNITIPVPFVTAGYGYGFDSTLTGFGAINVTSALYGNIQAELGATKNIFKQQGNLPGLSVTPVLNVISRPGSGTQLYPQADINLYWDYHRKRNFFYVGLCNWIDPYSSKGSGIKQDHHWLMSPLIGQTFVRRKWNYTVEAKVLAPGLDNSHIALDYKTPLGDNGAFGIYFGITRKF
jgi:hypothetical protein